MISTRILAICLCMLAADSARVYAQSSEASEAGETTEAIAEIRATEAIAETGATEAIAETGTTEATGASEESEATEAGGSEDMPYREKVFATEDTAELLEPDATLELLIKLEGHYKSGTSEEDKAKLDELNTLLAASNVNEEKCASLEQIEEYGNLIRQYSLYQINLVPYLEHFKRKQYKVCETVLSDRLKTLLEPVESDVKQSLQSLKTAVMNANNVEVSPLAASIDQINIARGIAAYFEQLGEEIHLTEVMQRRVQPFAALGSLVSEQVTEKCTKYREAVQPAMDIYALMLADKEFMDNADSLAMHWICIDRICETIIKDERQMTHGVHEELRTGSKYEHEPRPGALSS